MYILETGCPLLLSKGPLRSELGGRLSCYCVGCFSIFLVSIYYIFNSQRITESLKMVIMKIDGAFYGKIL